MTDKKSTNASLDGFFERPVSALATYYLLASLLTVPLFPLVYLVNMCKYWTLHYSFDEEGISAKWGVLWRREIHLTYRRIQDIHLTRNVVQRWLGLANVSVQTAGGSAGPEMVIEGAPDPDGLRDELYKRMRGISGTAAPQASTNDGAPTTAHVDSPATEAVALLEEIRDLIKERGS